MRSLTRPRLSHDVSALCDTALESSFEVTAPPAAVTGQFGLVLSYLCLARSLSREKFWCCKSDQLWPLLEKIEGEKFISL